MKIFVLNSGSSSFKCNLYEGNHLDLLWEGSLDWKSKNEPPTIKATSKNGKTIHKTSQSLQTHDALCELLLTMREGPTKVIEKTTPLDGIGHRVVHGGEKFTLPVLIDPEVKESIKDLFDLAPLHNPINLEGIEIMEKLYPGVPEVAVFDTAFHHTLSEKAYTYPGPIAWRSMGIRRFGFHGISHCYCAHQAAAILKKNIAHLNIVTCHLGNGASLAAVQKGLSIDTTMGFTPLEGLMMGTRSGTVDPGILLYLMEKNQTQKQLEHTLNFESGLKGISGNSDMRTLLQNKTGGDSHAKLAYEMYIHILKKEIAAMIASLGGIDALVFAGGIGEKAPLVRLDTCTGLKYLGIELDPLINQEVEEKDQVISEKHSKIPVIVIHTKENLSIAKDVLRIISKS